MAGRISRQVLLEQFAERLHREGFVHHDVAAAVLAARGSSHLNPHAFANSVGISVQELERIERGEVPHDELPSRLAKLKSVAEFASALALGPAD